ncbi:tRNA pseudouridine38-40 synthase [Flavobacteriaceae bacterium MAR_2010_188]|nr:tRNA pseudouridine38-40 synthase [Flavobacteriaceae bacterium MAR_2010_188]
MRYFVEFSYKGTNYHGWQNQPNAITVQEVLEKCMSTILSSEISLTGAGRTDAGVHAEQMFAHFDHENDLEANILFRLNSLLPVDIAVKHIFEVKKESHARFDAQERVYKYLINPTKNVFSNDLAYNYFYPLDIDKMNEACKLLLTYKDFQCFSKSNTDVKTYYCKLNFACWQRSDTSIRFDISADRFLRNMVRAIVGTMINIGTSKITIDDLSRILESKDRSEAGYSVPAEGLYLTKIIYPETIKLQV